MEKRRTFLIVAIDNDMRTQKSAQETVQSILNEMIGYYNPVVLLQETSADCGHPFYKAVSSDVGACGEMDCNNYYK